jgi:exonuclease III
MDREITPPPAKRRKVSLGDEKSSCNNVAPPTTNLENNTVIRIFSWNVNGITPFLQTSLTSFFSSPDKRNDTSNDTSTSLREFLNRHGWPQVLCLQEIKIGRGDGQTLASLKKAVNAGKKDNEPAYEVFTTLPQDKFNARGIGGKGRVYGVASIIRSDFREKYVAQVRAVDWDSEGRFSIITVRDPTSQQKLSIWNVYAVNGTNNAYRDPRTGEVTGTRHDRKLAVHRLMMEECLKLESDGWDVLIIGDLNVAPARIDGFPNLRTFPEQHVINRADFNKRFLDELNERGLGGVDVWRALRGNEKKCTYYPRNRPWGTSCDRVDLAIASRKLLDAKKLVACEIWNTEFERGPSDHVPISVDLAVET